MDAFNIRSGLIITSFIIFIGVDCQTITPVAKKDNICVGDNVTLDWDYSDPSTFATVTWKYVDSSSTEATIMEITVGDAVATVVGGYNVVHNENGVITLTNVTLSNSGTYKIIVTYLSAVVVESTVEVTIKECETATTPTPTPGTITTEEPCSWWCILLIGIGGLYLCGIVIGIFMYCCKDEPWNKINVEDKTYWWIFLLIIVIAGLGILTVYLICKVCGRFNGIIFNVENPAVFTAGERIEVICSLKKRVPEAVMHWHGKNEVEITATHGHPSVSIPEPGKKLLDLGVATEDKAGKYKSTATMTDNPQQVIYEKTLDIKIKDDSTQNEMPMNTKKKNKY